MPPQTIPPAGQCAFHQPQLLDIAHHGGGNYVFADGHAAWKLPEKFTTNNLTQNGVLANDPTDPLLTNGARSFASWGATRCPVFCCPQNVGMPLGDGEHPWFRP